MNKLLCAFVLLCQTNIALAATGRLSVVSDPPGAKVYSDGQLLGTTPLYAAQLPIGQRLLSLAKQGYLTQDVFVLIQAGTHQKLSYQLKRLQTLVRLSSTPTQSNVQLNGQYKGKTPLKLRLPGGKASTIELTKEGWYTKVTTLTPSQQRPLRLHIRLEKRPGPDQLSQIERQATSHLRALSFFDQELQQAKGKAHQKLLRQELTRLQKQPKTKGVLFKLATTYYMMSLLKQRWGNTHQKAIHYYKKLLQKRFSKPLTPAQVSHLYFQMGLVWEHKSRKQATRWYRRITQKSTRPTRLAPHAFEARIRLARLGLKQRRMPDQAIKSWLQPILKTPTSYAHGRALVLEAARLLKRNNKKQALQMYRKALQHLQHALSPTTLVKQEILTRCLNKLPTLYNGPSHKAKATFYKWAGRQGGAILYTRWQEQQRKQKRPPKKRR